MSSFYKIEGENEFAYFRADFRQILQIFQSDPDWTKNFVEMNNDMYGKVVKFDFVSNLAGTKLVEQGNSFFVIRGGQYFFYRIEGVDARTSRIVPERRLWAYWKFAVPFGLFFMCVVPVVFTPFVFSIKQNQALSMSKTYLEALCKYLEMQGKQIYGQKPNRRNNKMKNTIIIITIVIAMFLTACSSSGVGTSTSKEMTVNVDGKEQKFEPVTAWAYHTAFSYSAGGESSVSSSTTVVLANFELDTSSAFVSMKKRKIEKPEEYKVNINFVGEKGTNQDTPIRTGDYPAEGDVFNKIRIISISHFKDGKEISTDFDEKTMKGKLTITSVEGTTVNGNIDVTDGKNSVKGSFSANGHKSVK